MSDLLFPTLDEPYNGALRSCVEQIFRDYDVVAIIASGTIIRGTPDRRSDLDIHTLHRGRFRERVQAFHNGVPVELFVNPPDRIPSYFLEEAHDRRPMTAHMFATGVLIYDPTGVGVELIEEAKRTLQLLPEANLTKPQPAFYGPATQFEDADDLAERDPEGAALILGNAVWELVRCRFLSEPDWLPRGKDTLARLRQIDPESAELAIRATLAGEFKDRLEAARKLCLRITGTDGFFEWRSPRETV